VATDWARRVPGLDNSDNEFAALHYTAGLCGLKAMRWNTATATDVQSLLCTVQHRAGLGCKITSVERVVVMRVADEDVAHPIRRHSTQHPVDEVGVGF
jgi:hypothetical protein